jgi:hypothetical protein
MFVLKLSFERYLCELSESEFHSSKLEDICLKLHQLDPLINLLTSVPRTQIQFEDITLGRKFLRSEITRCSKRYLFFSFENHFTVCIYFRAVPSPHQRVAFHGSKRKVFCPWVRIEFQTRKQLQPLLYAKYTCYWLVHCILNDYFNSSNY